MIYENNICYISVSLTTVILLLMIGSCVLTGSLIPPNAVPALERVLSQDSAKTYTEKHDNPFNYQPYIPGSSSSNINNSRNNTIRNSSSSNVFGSSSNNTSSSNTNNSSTTSEEQNTEPPELLSMPTLVW